MSDAARWVLPRGTAGGEDWDVVVDDSRDGWDHTGLRVGSLDDGQRRSLELGAQEGVVIPLAGALTVHCADAAGVEHEAQLAGRSSVFAGPTDVAYLPRGSRVTLTGNGSARVAVALARAAKRQDPLPFRHVAADEVRVELRGSGQASREVRNFGTPEVLEADSIIACEVVTPAGNWSSYPPHKHDEERGGLETELEEIYYFEVQVEAGSPGAAGVDPLGYQRVFGTEARPIDVLAEVRTGDVVLVPHGWHGPSMAAPGYDLYYLNVMAGPGPERAWLICDHPDHAWVRATWPSQPLDPRLPFGGS